MNDRPLIEVHRVSKAFAGVRALLADGEEVIRRAPADYSSSGR